MMLTVSCKKESINATVTGGKSRIFVVHSLSIITLRIVKNDFRSGLPNQASFSFSIWPRREGEWLGKPCKHFNDTCKKHESCRSHLTNSLKLSLFGRLSIAEQLDEGYRIGIRKHNEEVRKNR